VGALTAVERVGAAGHAFRVLDHAGELVPDASIRLGGREFAADASGEIVIPFSTDPGTRQLVLQSGDLGVLHEFTHRPESYDLEATVHVEREALLAGERAELIVRPLLSVAGVRVRVELLEDPSLEITATDLDGVAMSTTVRGFALHDDQESVHVIRVPPRTARLAVELRGNVRSLSEARLVELESSRSVFTLNGIDATDEVLSPQLMRSTAGYVLEVRGKNGEPAGGRAVSIDCKHTGFRRSRHFALQTDEAGRVALGHLADIEHVRISGIGGGAVDWDLEDHAFADSGFGGSASDIHLLAGETLRLPYDRQAGAWEQRPVSLLELRSGAPAFDRTGDVQIAAGYLEVHGLGPGDYELVARDSGRQGQESCKNGSHCQEHQWN
jgi:hypothetical protein